MGMLNVSVPKIHNCEKKVYSVDDLMEILDISRSTAYILIKKNLFRSVKIGNQLRISKTSFDEWLDNILNLNPGSVYELIKNHAPFDTFKVDGQTRILKESFEA